jgi:hypothetical protein
MVAVALARRLANDDRLVKTCPLRLRLRKPKRTRQVLNKARLD